MSREQLVDRQGKVKPKPVVADKAAAPKVDTPLPAKPLQQPLTAATVSQVQQLAGNKAAQRMIQRRAYEQGGEVQEETASAIQQARGQGQPIAENIAAKAGATMGQDFSDVTVHTDSTSDQLNKAVGAKAFTTGSDIFFSSGAYDPHSEDGQHLIAHELTHVAQQGGSAPMVQTKMTVNDPNDQYEVEADNVADQVVRQPDVQREEMAEDDQLMGKWDVQREEMAEEDQLMGKWDVQREEMAEEDQLMGKWVQREEAPLEEEG